MGRKSKLRDYRREYILGVSGIMQYNNAIKKSTRCTQRVVVRVTERRRFG